MRARNLILIAAIAAALPAGAALAQTPAEQAAARAQAAERQRLDTQLRANEAQQNLRQFENQQRAADLNRTIDNQDLRQRTQENLANTPAPTRYFPTDLQPNLVVTQTIDTRAQATMQNAELQAENERLKKLDQKGK